jgi:hypothetical protein
MSPRAPLAVGTRQACEVDEIAARLDALIAPAAAKVRRNRTRKKDRARSVATNEMRRSRQAWSGALRVVESRS